MGYDHVIKQKTDQIDKLKVANNKLMDELISKLGFMDYRDFLALNRYLIEAKRHKKYH